MVDTANGRPTSAVDGPPINCPTADGRPVGPYFRRQVWNGTGWVLADDDRVFRPTSDPHHPPVGPAPADPAVFRPPDPPPWATHGRPETRTTHPPITVDDPGRTR